MSRVNRMLSLSFFTWKLQELIYFIFSGFTNYSLAIDVLTINAIAIYVFSLLLLFTNFYNSFVLFTHEWIKNDYNIWKINVIAIFQFDKKKYLSTGICYTVCFFFVFINQFINKNKRSKLSAKGVTFYNKLMV
jgi:hypothetical protein